MITQNVTLSNAYEDKYKKWNKINPRLALNGLQELGPEYHITPMM